MPPALRVSYPSVKRFIKVYSHSLTLTRLALTQALPLPFNGSTSTSIRPNAVRTFKTLIPTSSPSVVDKSPSWSISLSASLPVSILNLFERDLWLLGLFAAEETK